MQRVNPNSSIRRGYGFEDLFVLKLYSDWLKSPELFKEIRIQYAPPELGGSHFSIDDVVVTDSRGKMSYYQLKHKQHPKRDYWNFDELIGKGLTKWIQSIEAVKNETLKSGALITNGFPDKDIEACLEEKQIKFKKIFELNPEVIKLLKGKFSLKVIKSFFSTFNFEFGYPELGTFEKQIRDIYYYDLKATKDGVDNLLLEIARQGADPQPRSLSISEIRNLLNWDNPQPLNQGFEIPADFEFFDRDTHKDLIRTVCDAKGGIQVIIGKPGSGKSTYLSKLYQQLKSANVAVARHHYHLNPRDTSFRERLNSERVKEALRAEFKKEKREIIAELSYQNTEHTPLKEFINRIAKYYSGQGQSFVLIIDGLDHVLREGKSSDDLREFLNEILYPQAGFMLIIGTQEMATPFFPNIIWNYCPKENWIEIKGLKKGAVANILRKHKVELKLDSNKEDFRIVVDKLFQKTSGNPLHLRYVLTQLANTGVRIGEDEIKAILPYRDEIKEYYGDLWRQLPSVAKSMCFSIGFLDFRLQEEELMELAEKFTRYPAEIQTSYSQIKHLIKNDLYGISVYHNSFLVFLLNSEELSQQKKAIYGRIKTWLKNSQNAELKWSELPKVEYYLGNPKLLLKIDRDWLVDSFINCRDEHQIEKLLDLAVEAAFTNNDFEKVINLRLLETYFANRSYNLHDTLQKIWITAFGLKEKVLGRIPEFQKFNHYQIKEILVTLNESGRLRVIPEEVTERFNDFFSDRDNEYADVIRSWTEIAAAFDSRNVNDVHRFIVQARKSRDSGQYFAYYCNLLLNQKNYHKVTQLLRTELIDSEKLSIDLALANHDLRSNAKRWQKKIKLRAHNLLEFYFGLLGNDIKPRNLPNHSQFPKKVEVHSMAKEHTGLYENILFSGIHLKLAGRDRYIEKWIKNGSEEWPSQLGAVSLRVGMYLGTCIKENKKCELSVILNHFETLRKLDYYDDHDIYELRRVVVPFIIEEALQLQSFINIHNRFDAALSGPDCSILLNNRWLYKNDIIALFTSKRVAVSDEGFEQYRVMETQTLSKEIMPFRDRAERQISLAIIAKELGKKDAASLLLKDAAQNIIAYGNHKDMLLYSIMRSIDICTKAGSKKSKQYLREIGKYIYRISDLTDGDETSSFIYNYGQFLAETDHNLLYNFYLTAESTRQYNLAENLFGDCLSTLNFSSHVGNAIAGTAVDKNSYNSLSFLSKKNKHAARVLKQIQAVFGNTDFSDDNDRNSHEYGKDKSEKINLRIYDAIPPAELSSHFDKIQGVNFYNRKHEQSDFLHGWAKRWLNKRKVPLRQVILAIKTVCNHNFADINEKVLDYFYPFAIKVDNEFAFDCSVWAFSNSSSWSEEYIRNMKESRERWSKVIRDFPKRIDEFFKKSIMNSGRYYGKSDNAFFIPIPKGTQFFIDCGRLDVAETITEHSIKALTFLFPGIQLEEPGFITHERKISPFELLTTRFKTISPLVRERAAWHLSELLVRDESGRVHKAFLAELSKIELENIACNFLLVFIKSLTNSKSQSHRHLSVNRIIENLSVSSRAIQVLLTRIASLLKAPLVFDLLLVSSITHQLPNFSKEQFLKKIGTYLPLAYIDYLENIQRKVSIPIWEIWCNKYKERCDDMTIVETQSDQDYANERREYMTARATVFSDILRSTFSEMIDYLYELGLISGGDLTHYTFRNLPVDPSIWNIKLSKRPDWWPQFCEVPAGKKENRLIGLRHPVEKLFTRSTSGHLLHLSGAVTSFKRHYSDTLEGTIQIVPFAYKGNLNKTDGKHIFDTIINTRHSWFPLLYKPYIFGFFENQLDLISDDLPINIDDLTIVPLTAGIIPPGPHMWQYYRWRYDFRLLAPLLSQNLKLSASNGQIRYLKDKQCVAKVLDFADGLRDRAGYKRTIPAGNYIEIDNAYLKDTLSSNDLKLAHIIHQKQSVREYSFSDDETEIESFDLI